MKVSVEEAIKGLILASTELERATNLLTAVVASHGERIATLERCVSALETCEVCHGSGEVATGVPCTLCESEADRCAEAERMRDSYPEDGTSN